MRTPSRRRLTPFAALALAACTSVDPEASLDAVAALAAERGTPPVAWPREPEARTAADARVAELLARPLAADDAVEIAFLRNRALASALAELGIAQAELVQAGLPENPVLSANVRFGLGPSGTGVEAGLVQELLGLLQLPLRTRIAAEEREATRLEVAAALHALATDVRSATFAAQGAAQRLELRRTVLEATALAAEVARRQHEAGNVSDLDAAAERALHEEAKLDFAEAELDAEMRREALTALLGVWGEEAGFAVEARLPALPAADAPRTGLESRAVATRLDLLAARRRVGASAAQAAFARFYGLVPEAHAGVASERELEGGWSLGPAIDVPIPLFDRRQARLAMARAEERQSEERVASLALAIRSDVRAAWLRLRAARARAHHRERVLMPLRTQILGEAQRAYNAMQIGVPDLLAAKRDEVLAGVAWVDSLEGYWTSRVALERAVGTALPLDPQTDTAGGHE
jgi:outer membrane protein, heavy metal efflux system